MAITGVPSRSPPPYLKVTLWLVLLFVILSIVALGVNPDSGAVQGSEHLR